MYIPKSKNKIAQLIQRYELFKNRRKYSLKEILKNKEGNNRQRFVLIGWLAKFK